MKKKLTFLISIFIISLMLSVINRIFFLVYNSGLLTEYSLIDLLKCFIHGFSLDASIAAYITILPALATLASIWTPIGVKSKSVWTWIFRIYFLVMSSAVAIVETADIGMFGDWLCRIDSQIYIYTLAEMMASVSLSSGLAGFIYFAGTVTLAILAYDKAVKRLFVPSAENSGQKINARIAGSFVMLICTGIIFLVMRGGVTTATANVSKAYFSKDMLLNQLAVNPVFSLMESTFEMNDSELDNYDAFDPDTAEHLFAEAQTVMTDSTSQCTGKWLKTDRPDIVLVVMEGMGRTITDICENEEPVTPELIRLREEGIWFDKMYASSFRTDRGNVAIFSGFPGQPNMSIMKFPNKASKLPGLATSLKNAGYRTRFTYGGDANFTNTRAYIFSCGFEELTDETSMSLSGHRSKWGYADDIVLDYAADKIIERISQDDSPVFDAILTLSSHEPFEVPYKRLDNPMLNSFAFTDAQIGRFVEKLRNSPAWENLLIILLPDHSTPHPVSIGNNSPERHHIPMHWLGGAIKENMTVNEYMSQTDIAATLLGQLGLSHKEFIFSKDVSNAGSSKFAYWAFNNGFGLIDVNGVTIFDYTTGKELRREGDPDSTRLNHGKAILQKTFIEIRKL